MTTKPFSRVLNPGISTVYGGRITPVQVYIKVEYGPASPPEEGKMRLSISGVVGPKANGDAVGSCGQISEELTSEYFTPANGWDRGMVDVLLRLWEDWHLNDMRAGCEHQRADGWNERRIDPSKPAHTYGKHFEGQRSSTWNLWGWIRPSEHPEGLMTAPCPECGYGYGTSWLYEEVPVEVLETLKSFPETERMPAWV